MGELFKELFLNLCAIGVVALPIVALEGLRHRSRWLNKNHDWLSILVWISALAVLYIWVLPFLGLKPNPRVIHPD